MTTSSLPYLRQRFGATAAARFPTVPLGQFPTPLEQVNLPGNTELWIKRDDLSGQRYGGNKVRKLELLMAAAMARDARSVITFGAAGSNHALATALAARELGLRRVNILGPQVNSEAVRRNLMASFRAGTELVYAAWRDTPLVTARQFLRLWREDGRAPSVIPPGGSSPLGALGFVNAALELADQWARHPGGPPPDVVYVASGTMGTCVGLVAGLALAGWPTRVEAVRVTVAPFTSMIRARAMYRGIGTLLREAGVRLPAWKDDRFRLRDDFFGGEYALHTPESASAVGEAWNRWGLRLEGTYTGKTMAACLWDSREGKITGKRVVFWNTYNSRQDAYGNEPENAHASWRALPAPFHRFFEEPVQDLDAVM